MKDTGNGLEKVDSKVVTEADGWKYSFDNLPKFENGEEIKYSIDEETVEGYTKSIDGYNLKNSYTPGKTSVSVTKTWNDDSNRDGIRPASITIHLYADGKDTGKTLTLTEDTNWKGSFEDLPEKNAGKAITYTIQEDEVSGYITIITGDAESGFDVTNQATSVKVSKVDAANAKELAGATIQIIDESGKVVAEWVSTTEAHEVTGLAAGRTYTLHETVAPAGYDLSEQDTTFSIADDGTVQAGTTRSVNGVLLVEDNAKRASLSFNKVDPFGRSLSGASMAVIRIDGGSEITVDSWTTDGNAHVIEGMSDGSYLLREFAAPSGYELAQDIAFSVKDGKAALTQQENGNLVEINGVQTVVMTDGVQLGVRDQRFAKVDEAGNYLAGAKFQITTEDGNIVSEWVSDASEHLEELTGGSYILTEVEAPSGYSLADPIRFTVDEKGFVTSIDGQSVSGATDVLIKMTDKKLTEEAETETETETTGKTESTKTTGHQTGGVKTGDNTPILPTAGALLLSAFALLLILRNRVKKIRKK